MRLHDPRTGRVEDVPNGVLRLRIHGTGLRVHVVADLLRRVAERNGRTVVPTRSADPEIGRPLEDFNVRPADRAPLETADLHVAEISVPGRCVTVPPATGDWPPDAGAGAVDPLAVRLALLAVRYRDPLVIGPHEVNAAARRLARWRSLVAEWARSPGRPMSRPYADEAGGLLADDLDVPGALAVLDRLAADDEVPQGAKIETFIHLDLLLGLEVVRDIGR